MNRCRGEVVVPTKGYVEHLIEGFIVSELKALGAEKEQRLNIANVLIRTHFHPGNGRRTKRARIV
jgi:hypothetical protein